MSSRLLEIQTRIYNLLASWLPESDNSGAEPAAPAQTILENQNRMYDLLAARFAQMPDEIVDAVLQYLEDHPEAIDQAAVEAILDGRLDDIEEDLGGLKSALNSMSTATASDEGKALMAKTVSDGKVTEWEFGEAGGGTVYPSSIDMNAVTETEDLTVSFDDGKYVTGYYNTASNANMSVMDVDLSDFPSGATALEYTAYDNSSGATAPQFLLNNGSTVVVTRTSSTNIEYLLWKVTCAVPAGAVAFRTTVYTSKKSASYVKATVPVTYTPQWIGLPDNAVKKDDIDQAYEETKTEITATYEDGYVTMYGGSPQSISNFNEHTAIAGFSTAVLSGITPLSLYEIDSYYNVEVSAGGIVVWYDANGNRITDEYGVPYNYVLSSNVVPDVSQHYRQIVMAPLRAATGKIVISLTNKSYYTFNLVTPSRKAFEWLSINVRNLDSQSMSLLAQNMLDLIAAKSYTLKTVVDRSVAVSGKSVVLFGDSIAAGVASGTTDSNFKSWANTVKDRMGLTLDNQAVSATTITNTDSSATAISAKVLAYTGSAKIAIIAGGTNDHTNSKPLGEWGDTAVTTFYGALYAMCEYLKTLSLDKVVFITPINKSQRYSNPVSLDKYREAIQITARQYGFDVVEGRDFGFPTSEGVAQQLWLPDNLHPSQSGHVMYANNVCGLLG